MKSHLLAMGAVVFLAAGLAACGGGGAGTNGGPPPTTPAPTPTQYALGDAFTFDGSQTTVATFAYPSPSPYPSTNTTLAVTQHVTVTNSADPYGPPGAGDFHTVENDASALVAHTVTTDAWLSRNGADLVEYGYKTADDSGDTLGAQFSAPAIQDELPESNGASWSNGAGVTYNEKDSDGTTSTRTYASNGTYVENTTSLLGVQTSITESADGSGSLVTNGAYLGGQVNSLIFSKPSSGQITVTVNFAQPPSPTPNPSGHPTPTPVPTNTPRVYTAPVWYPLPPAFYSQSTHVTTGVSYPSACNVPGTYGSSGNELVQTTNRLDTILGYTDVQTQTTYTNTQFGPVCVVLTDTQQDYYDYQDDFATATAFHLHFPGTALSSSTISETLTLQSGATVHDARRRTESQSPSPLSAACIAGARAALTLAAERKRLAREVRFTRFMLSPRRTEIRS